MGKVTAPTLLVQGIADSLFGLDQADATAQALAASGTPYAVRWSDGGHDAPSSHEAEETEASYAWLDHYVRDRRAARESALPTAGFTFPTPASRRSRARRPVDDAAHTPASTAPQFPRERLPLAATAGGLLHPPGGQPASMVAVPGSGSPGPQPVDLPDRRPARAVDVLRHRAGAAQP